VGYTVGAEKDVVSGNPAAAVVGCGGYSFSPPALLMPALKNDCQYQYIPLDSRALISRISLENP